VGIDSKSEMGNFDNLKFLSEGEVSMRAGSSSGTLIEGVSDGETPTSGIF
jgi:hypothetical protein